MRFFCALCFLTASISRLAAQDFAAELATKVQSLEKTKAAAVAGSDGWLFFGGELRFLSQGQFWGAEAENTHAPPKPEVADPLPAILDFQKQLSARGIALVLVPIPPKIGIYPEKIAPGLTVGNDDAMPYLHRFYDELRSAGVEVLDVTPVFLRDKESSDGPVFCKTDTHFSGVGCVRTAQAMAEYVRQKISVLPKSREYTTEWTPVEFKGDLVNASRVGGIQAPPEKVTVRRVTEKNSQTAVQPDENSPVLVLGDSHALVFHEFLAERAGLLDQLAAELGFPVDLIAARGSGSTPLRLNLYRRSAKQPEYLGKKKILIWCFAAREFTESSEGWAKVPIAK
jgi:hypothetical protein